MSVQLDRRVRNACVAGDLDEVNTFLSTGLSADGRYDKKTAVMWALESGGPFINK